MSELIADCPRCGASKITFNLNSFEYQGKQYNWKRYYEAFCICRNCQKGTIFLISQKEVDDGIEKLLSQNSISVNNYMQIEKYINVKDNTVERPPEYLPKNIEEIFIEGITCKSVECFNASAAMFRLCLDLATKDLLQKDDINGLNNKIRRSLGLRLEWLFNNKVIPDSLKELASSIKDDGNDGAHEGILNKTDLEDVFDFTYFLLERLYTEPKRIELANERRVKRHLEGEINFR